MGNIKFEGGKRVWRRLFEGYEKSLGKIHLGGINTR